jgi:hypothetical protein
MILKMLDTIYYHKQMRNSVKLFIYTPYPGTPLYERSLELGLPESKRIEDWITFGLGEHNTQWVPVDIVRKVSMLEDYIFRWVEDEWFTKLKAIRSRFRPLLVIGGLLLRLLARFRWRFKWFGLPLDHWFVKAATSRVMMMHARKKTVQ